MDDSILGLLFEVSADPSKAVSGLKLFEESATVSTEKIQQAVQNATIALEQTQNKAFAVTQLVAAGLTEEAAQATVAALSMRQVVQQTDEWAVALGTANRGMSEAEVAATDFSTALGGGSETQGLTGSLTKSRLGLMEIEQLTGVHVPRGINTFLSSLSGVGPAIAAAFSTIAIIGILEIIATQLPAAFEKLEEKITGWDKTAKKAYQDQLELNQKYLDIVRKVADEDIANRERRNDITATEGLKERIALAQKEVDLQTDQVGKLEQALQYQKEYQTRLQAISEGATGIDLPKPDPRSAAELNEELKKAKENAEKATLAFKELSRAANFRKAAEEDVQKEQKGDRTELQEAERQLKLQEDLDKKSLDQRSITAQEYKKRDADALQRWYESTVIILNKHLEDVKKVEGEKSDNYKAILGQLEAAEDKRAEHAAKTDQVLVTNAHKSAEEQKHAITQHLEEIQQGANRELEIEMNLTKRLTEIDTSHLNFAEQTRLAKLKEANAAEATLQQDALQRWYATQSEAIVKAAEQMKKLFGAASPEYQAAIAKMSALDDQFIIHSQKIATERTAANRKADEEIVKFHNESVKAMMELEKKQEEELAKELHEVTQKRVRDILDLSKENQTAEKQSADRRLRADQEYLRDRYRLHQISGSQFEQLQTQALQRWYMIQKTALDRQLAAAKAVYGEDHKEYARLVHAKEALNDEYNRQQQQTTIQTEKINRQMINDALNGLDMLAGAMKNHHALEIGLIIAKAAVRMTEEIAAGYAAAAIPGMQWSAALHFLSAAEYGIVAGAQAAGGGASRAGASPSGGSSGIAGSGSNLGPPASFGGQGRSIRVIVMGENESGHELAKILTRATRFGGAQLTASHLLPSAK